MTDPLAALKDEYPEISATPDEDEFAFYHATDVWSAIDEAFALGRQSMREEAAKVADAYADETIQMAGDSVLHDPVLSGGPMTEEAINKSRSLMIYGCIHSSMFHASQNIATAIRALPINEDPDNG